VQFMLKLLSSAFRFGGWGGGCKCPIAPYLATLLNLCNIFFQLDLISGQKDQYSLGRSLVVYISIYGEFARLCVP
jgi:hypothetical protein